MWAEFPKEWGPIATAPKDGSEVLVCTAGTGDLELVRWSDDYATWLDRTHDPFLHATHWLELPSIPELISRIP